MLSYEQNSPLLVLLVGTILGEAWTGQLSCGLKTSNASHCKHIPLHLSVLPRNRDTLLIGMCLDRVGSPFPWYLSAANHVYFLQFLVGGLS